MRMDRRRAYPDWSIAATVKVLFAASLSFAITIPVRTLIEILCHIFCEPIIVVMIRLSHIYNYISRLVSARPQPVVWKK